MTKFYAFLKKELLEYARNRKLLVLICVFLIFGLMNPLFAKYAPQILSEAVKQSGLAIEIPEPTPLDAWAQFYKNISQMGLIVIIILFGSAVSSEISRGTLVNMLSKGMPRRTVIFAKTANLSIMWTAAYWLCWAVTLVYTIYFFGKPGDGALFAAAVPLWLFGIALITSLVFGGALSGVTFGSMLIGGGWVCILLLINLIPGVEKYNAITAASVNVSVLAGAKKLSALLYPTIGCIIWIAAFVAGAAACLQRKKL